MSSQSPSQNPKEIPSMYKVQHYDDEDKILLLASDSFHLIHSQLSNMKIEKMQEKQNRLQKQVESLKKKFEILKELVRDKFLFVKNRSGKNKDNPKYQNVIKSYICIYENCQRKYSTRNSFKTHFKMKHLSKDASLKNKINQFLKVDEQQYSESQSFTLSSDSDIQLISSIENTGKEKESDVEKICTDKKKEEKSSIFNSNSLFSDF